MCEDLDDLALVAQEREEVARLAKVLYARKRELEGVLKSRLEDQDELVLGGVRYRMFNAASKEYPLERTLSALASATGETPKALLSQVGSIDKKSLDALVKKLAKSIGKDRATLLKAELDAVRVDRHPLEPLDHVSVKVRPERLADADPKALEVNGYSDDAWRDAISLGAGLRRVAPLLEGALVAGHNVGFDWAFLARAFADAGPPLPDVDDHRLDTASLGWPLFASAETDSLSLDAVCKALGLHRPSPHRALADAMASLEVARKLRDRALVGRRVANLVADERPIVEALLDRIEGGRDEYGPWVARVTALCRTLTEDGFAPIAPQLYLPGFLDETTQRDEALALCLELLDACAVVRDDHAAPTVTLLLDDFLDRVGEWWELRSR